jgi:ribonuclease VapC
MIVFDSSAILAVILDEAGSDVVRDRFGQAVISTCNAAEVYTKILQLGLSRRAPDVIFGSDNIDIVPLSLSQARAAGEMVMLTGKAGLSLGDRCCLALAIERKLPVLTADRPWAQFADPLGLDIRLIR